MSAGTVYTIGHSTRTLESFIGLLREFQLCTLADIRSYPASRRFPHFNREPLSVTVGEAGMAYAWLKKLGGRRRSVLGDQSPNKAWRHTAFRAYADYMLTPEFREGIDELLVLAAAGRTAIMCSEAVYWRCHRRLVSDYLVNAGWKVLHIMGPGSLREHELTPGAIRMESGVLNYPPLPSDEVQARLF